MKDIIVMQDYKILDITLLDSLFHRESDIPQETLDREYTLEIIINSTYDGNILKITENVHLKKEDAISFVVVIQAEVLFENTSKEEAESWGKNRGANLLFPYVSAEINHLATHAGLGTLHLPLIDFEKF